MGPSFFFFKGGFCLEVFFGSDVLFGGCVWLVGLLVGLFMFVCLFVRLFACLFILHHLSVQ